NLGYSCEHGFVPLDSEIFISDVKVQGLHEKFKDGRSIAGKRYLQALQLTKPKMAKGMMARAIRGGINADFLLADAWFGTKPMLRSAEELSLTAIVRRGVAIFAKACFGHPSPSKRQKLNATANTFGAPDVLRTCHFATTIVNSVLAS
ncbi:transposase, partial [Bathymodiolus platifrons methanotrophic gill symbiont]|uniref:transposase n=1 Tax=Bathymodiolus platifrons methanotrophic gill symbiont TaxID=113268 RepID=UPI001C8F17A7